MFQLIKYQNKNPNVIAIFLEVISKKYVESSVFIQLMFVQSSTKLVKQSPLPT